MKLLGFHNNNQIIASVGHHDYIATGKGDDYLMADGGQAGTGAYAGYYRFHGKEAWFEVPQTLAELYNDYNIQRPRKYGIWNLDDVRLLSPEEIPDTNSFEWIAENAIWGTNGLDGNSPTTYVLIKDCSKDHLAKISELLEKRGNKELKKVVGYWLTKK